MCDAQNLVPLQGSVWVVKITLLDKTQETGAKLTVEIRETPLQ